MYMLLPYPKKENTTKPHVEQNLLIDVISLQTDGNQKASLAPCSTGRMSMHIGFRYGSYVSGNPS